MAINETSTLQTKRAHERLDYDEACLIQSDKRALHGRTKNLSEGGMCFSLQGLGTLTPGETISLSIHTLPSITCIVRWISERTVGVQFTDDPENRESLNILIGRLKTGEPAAKIAPQKPDETRAIPMRDIIAWVKGLE